LYRFNRAVTILDVRTKKKGVNPFPTCGHKISLESPMSADIITEVLETFSREGEENAFVKHVKAVRSNKEEGAHEVDDVHPAFQEVAENTQDGDKWSFEVAPPAEGKHLLWGNGVPAVDAFHPSRGFVELKTGHLTWINTIDQALRYGIPILEEGKHDLTFVSETVESGLQEKIDHITAPWSPATKTQVRVLTYEQFDKFMCDVISMKLKEKGIVFPRSREIT